MRKKVTATKASSRTRNPTIAYRRPDFCWVAGLKLVDVICSCPFSRLMKNPFWRERPFRSRASIRRAIEKFRRIEKLVEIQFLPGFRAQGVLLADNCAQG